MSDITLEEVLADTERSIAASRKFRATMKNVSDDMCIKMFVGMLEHQLSHIRDELSYEEESK